MHVQGTHSSHLVKWKVFFSDVLIGDMCVVGPVGVCGARCPSCLVVRGRRYSGGGGGVIPCIPYSNDIYDIKLLCL